jgi:hypothetical protein
MDGSKLYLQLLSLSKEELKGLRHFLEKTPHGKDSLEYRLFNHLHPVAAEKQDKKPDKKELFKHLFPKEKGFDLHKDKRVRNIMSKLSKQLEEFLALQELDEDPILRQRLLIKAYEKRKASTLFLKEIEVQKKRLEEAAHRGSEYFWEMTWLHNTVYFHTDTLRSETSHHAFASSAESLELSFILSLLYWQAESVSRRLVLNEATTPHLLEPALLAARHQYATKHPVIGMFLQLIEPGKSPDLNALKKSVFDCQTLLNPFEKSLAFKMLVNYTIAQANMLGKSQAESLLNLYKTGLDQGFLDNKTAMDSLQFINIVIAGGAAGEFDWAKEFIKDRQKLLSKKDREKTTLLCEAYLYYYRAVGLNGQADDFNNAMLCLHRIKRADEIIELHFRSLQMRVAYDACKTAADFATGMSLMLEYTSSFKKYLKGESNLSEEVKRDYNSFIDNFKEIILLKNRQKDPQYDSKDYLEEIARFKQHLKQAAFVRLKHWLEEKAAEL